MNPQNPFAKLENFRRTLAIDEAYDREIARLRESRERLAQQMKIQAQARREKQKRQNAES